MKIERIEVRQVSMPLVRPFETSFGREDKEVHLIVKLFADGLIGYGESPVSPNPGYAYETVETAWHVQNDFIGPAILGKTFTHPRDFLKTVRLIRGHHFAKHGFECALWHLYAQQQQKPLYRLLGGTQTTIRSGVSVGIEASTSRLLEVIEAFLVEGYKRIKIKIKPGWDVEPVRAIRERFGDIPLMVDANSAYTLNDLPTFKELDQFELMMIEQPLHYEDLTEHAQLQAQLNTPICLDESIASVSAAKAAIALKSCRIINIKPARIGGLIHAITVHDLCQENGLPVWCGGMLEMGIGRAFNLALSALPNFSLPGDVSSSKKYFKQDIINPEVLFTNGEFQLTESPGLGFEPKDKVIEHFTERKKVLK